MTEVILYDSKVVIVFDDNIYDDLTKIREAARALVIEGIRRESSNR